MKCCNNQNIIDSNGFQVCNNCGITHGRIFVVQEKKDIKKKAVKDSKHYNNTTILGSTITYKETKNKNLWRNYKRNKEYLYGKERNIIRSHKILLKYMGILNLSYETIYYIFNMFKKMYLYNSIRTRPLEYVIGAYIYLGLKELKIQRSFKEISIVDNLKGKKLWKQIVYFKNKKEV